MTIMGAAAVSPVAVAATTDPARTGAVADPPGTAAVTDPPRTGAGADGCGTPACGSPWRRLVAAARPRRQLLSLLTGAAVVLVPWIAYLANSLPTVHTTRQWKVAWVGFDVALLSCLAVAAWLGWRRHRAAVPVLIATAALLLSDAWFDVTFDWGGADPLDGWTSLAMAVAVEIPLAVFLLMRARLLLSGDIRRRPLTASDISEVFTHPDRQRVMRALDSGGTAGEVARVLGIPVAEVAGHLRVLAGHGFVEAVTDRGVTRMFWRVPPARDVRFRPAGQDLRWPDRDHLDPAARAVFERYARRRAVEEVALLARASAEWRYPDDWRWASRGHAWLSREELRAFSEEYTDLLNRYGQRHRGPGPGLRPVAIRWYAFPPPRPEAEGCLPGGRWALPTTPPDLPAPDLPATGGLAASAQATGVLAAGAQAQAASTQAPPSGRDRAAAHLSSSVPSSDWMNTK